jgi:hypothetical protein
VISFEELRHVAIIKEWSRELRAGIDAVHAAQRFQVLRRLVPGLIPGSEQMLRYCDHLDWFVALVERETGVIADEEHIAVSEDEARRLREAGVPSFARKKPAVRLE